MSFWCVTTFFNPAGYSSLAANHALFAANLRRQGVNLLTVEVAFGDDPFYLKGDVVTLRSPSCMWLKERLINWGVSQLPPDCDSFAWVDCDLLFGSDDWALQAADKLKTVDVLQLFRRVYYMPKGDIAYQNRQDHAFDGIVAQRARNRRWLERREDKDLPFACPGFAWAARRGVFDHVGGIYDKDIVGSGDCVLVDCLMGTWKLHGHDVKFNDRMKQHIDEWSAEFGNKQLEVDYLPVDLFHLWHGSLRNRRYMRRHEILRDHDYDPKVDVRLSGPVFEWATAKPEMHQAVKDYFYARLEDSQ